MTVDIKKLKNYALFGGLSPDVLDYLKSKMERRNFLKDELIFEAGSDGDEICFILEGRVAIVADGERIASIGEGEEFGELHIIDILPRSADVVADSNGSLLVLRHMDMYNLRNKDPEAFTMLMMNCGREASRRLRAMNQNYVNALLELKKLKSRLSQTPDNGEG